MLELPSRGLKVVQPSPAIATKGRCRRCGGTLILTDEDGRRYCAMCLRPYKSWADYGRIGGLQTTLRYGRDYMAEIGRRGGRPRLRQLPAPETENKIREGLAAQPNNLKVLKELWRERRGELLAAKCSSLEVN